jgi:hypothetical protein
MKIFVQIASYRDSQLIPTIEDMLENAKYPNNLVIGICHQYHPDDSFSDLSKYKVDSRFRIIDVLYSESNGACWARHQVQQVYGGEEYTLQIDSHMRFEKDWDITLIDMLNGLIEDGIEKPILTGYVSSFDPNNDPDGRVRVPWEMSFDRFIPEGAVFFLPDTIPNWEKLVKPVPARFYSAHFAFTLGIFSKEVQHNPEFYFHGEEISIGVRAYTHGYDLFHPHKVIIWHEYTREGRTKQWDDDSEWSKKNELAHKKNRQLFGMDGEVCVDGKYGFGDKRTLLDYEKYSGLKFDTRSVQQYTLDKKYPPNPYNFDSEKDWLGSFTRVFKHCIDLGFSQVPETDYEFWVVAFHGTDDVTLFREDANKDEIKRILSDKDYCKIWREFQSSENPSKWVVWPYSTSKGWCDKIEGYL